MEVFRRTFLAAAGMAIVVLTGAGKVRKRLARFRTMPRQDCELPNHDYIQGGPSQPVLGISKIGILVPVADASPPDTLPSGHKMYYYQLNQAALRIDHCSISRVAFAIRDDGYWTLSLRADQNQRSIDDTPLVAVGIPKPPGNTSVPQPGPILPGASPNTKFTDHIKRNLFSVKVRGYTAYLIEEAADAGLGRPVLFDLSPDPFWVQRQVPEFRRFQGTRGEIGEFFRTIDRVEIELSYR
jgi:hypothetical protein